MTQKLQTYILEKGMKYFEVWSSLVSDDILALAHAFGERFMVSSAIKALDGITHLGAHALLEKTIYMTMLEDVLDHLGWYL
jgi:hypothetical protein